MLAARGRAKSPLANVPSEPEYPLQSRYTQSPALDSSIIVLVYGCVAFVVSSVDFRPFSKAGSAEGVMRRHLPRTYLAPAV